MVLLISPLQTYMWDRLLLTKEGDNFNINIDSHGMNKRFNVIEGYEGNSRSSGMDVELSQRRDESYLNYMDDEGFKPVRNYGGPLSRHIDGMRFYKPARLSRFRGGSGRFVELTELMLSPRFILRGWIEPIIMPLASSPGDWVVTGNETRVDEEIVLTGNLIVKDGGNLTLINVALFMNCSYDGEFGLRVEGGGVLNILGGSIITAYNPEYRFEFFVSESSTFRMYDSELHNSDCLAIETDDAVIGNSCISGNYYSGIALAGSDAIIYACNISGNHYFGIAFSNSSPTIYNCIIKDNMIGIHSHRSHGATILNNAFINDSILLFGEELRHYFHHIENNTVNGKPLYYIVNATGLDVPDDAGSIIVVNSENVTIRNMKISNTDCGISLAYTRTSTVEDSFLNNSLIGICSIYTSHLRIDGCEFTENTWGIINSYSDSIRIFRCEFTNLKIGIANSYSNSTALGCTITGNSLGILNEYVSILKVHYSNIYGNEMHGLFNEGEPQVDATYNWWGSPEGPEYKAEGDPEDPEEIYGDVLYDPWLTEPFIGFPPPLVEILSPSEGETLSGVVTIIADASDPLGIDRVEFYVDGDFLGVDYELPYECSWNTSSYPNGNYTITVTAYNLMGNISSDAIWVIVYNIERRAPIHIVGNEEFTAENGVIGGSGTREDPYIIGWWVIDASEGHGVWIENTTAYFIVRGCYIHDGFRSGSYGVYLYNVTNGCVERSIIIRNSEGIYVNNSYGITVFSNNITNNEFGGIMLESSLNCTVTANYITYNDGYGVRLDGTSYTVIAYNYIEECYWGIGLFSEFGIITQNIIERNIIVRSVWDGLVSFHSNGDVIIENTIVNSSECGIYVSNSLNLVITRNSIINSTDYGVYLSLCFYITIYHNDFINNGGETSQAYDGGGHSNQWNSTSEGNHWSDWTEPDEDGDGIVDKPYKIDGGDSYDYYPLVEPVIPIFPPKVNILSPFEGERLSGIATIVVEALDPYGIDRVEFYVDDISLGIDYEPPYKCDWDTVPYPNGNCTITAVAYNRIGIKSSESIWVILHNVGYRERDPIVIMGNEDFTVENGVLGGSGTREDPYIIERWKIRIDSGRWHAGIYISGTDAHFVVRNCYVEVGSNAFYGVYLDTINGRIENLTILGGTETGLDVHSVNCTITNNTISESRTGIDVGGKNVNVTGNKVENCMFGMSVSGDVRVAWNHIKNCSWIGILLTWRMPKLISNKVENCEVGIHVGSCTANSKIMGNRVRDCKLGIELHWVSSGVILRENRLDRAGLSITGWNITHYYIDIDSSNLIDGKPVCYLLGKSDLVIDGGVGYLGLVQCNNITVINLNISRNGQGVLIVESTEVTVEGSILDGNNIGIYILGSEQIRILKNNISHDEPSFYNYGVYLEGGIPFGINTTITIAENNIKGYEHGIYVRDYRNITIAKNIIEKCSWEGIDFFHVFNSTITQNEITDGRLGIDLYFSSNNTFTRNRIVNNIKYAVYIESCRGIRFYYNDFINNRGNATPQVYRGRYTEHLVYRMNYWSDWTEPDENGDFIVDKPYPAHGYDPYPLVNPVAFGPAPSDIKLDPNPTNDSQIITVTATVSSIRNLNITAAYCTIEQRIICGVTLPLYCNIPMAPLDGKFDSQVEEVTIQLNTSNLPLCVGGWKIRVWGEDLSGLGPPELIKLNVTTSLPVTVYAVHSPPPDWPLVMGDEYYVAIVVENPSAYLRPVSITCYEYGAATDYKDKRYGPKICTVLIPPNDISYIRFDYSHTWRWLWPLEQLPTWVDALSFISSFIPTPDVVTTVSHLVTILIYMKVALLNNTYTYTFSSEDVEGLEGIRVNVTVWVPYEKVAALFASWLYNVLGSSATGIGHAALSARPDLALAFFACEALANIKAMELFRAACDPEANYTQIVVPEPITIPEIEELDESPAKVLAKRMVQLLANVTAFTEALVRYDYARQIGDSNWMIRHLRAVANYTELINASLMAVNKSMMDTINLLHEMNITLTFTEEEIEKIKDWIRNEGLPEIEVKILRRLGFTDEEISSIMEGFLEMPSNYLTNCTYILMKPNELIPAMTQVSHVLIERATLLCNVSSSRAWIYVIKAGEEWEIDLTELNLIVRRIIVRAKDNIKDAVISCDKLPEKPIWIPKPPGAVYGYINLTTNISPEKVGEFEIQFRVDKTWIYGRNLDGIDVTLYRFNGRAWTPIVARLIGEDNDYFYYSAVTPTHSLFAVVGIPSLEPSIISPTDWAYLRGMVYVSVYVGGVWFAGAELYINGRLVETWTISGEHTHMWDTTGHPDGSYIITLSVYDDLGNIRVTSVSVVLDNTEPIASVISPSNGTYVSEICAIEVYGNDTNMRFVELYIDGVLAATWNVSGTHIYNMNTTIYADGEHFIVVISYDAAGNIAKYTLSITVDNTPPIISNVVHEPSKPDPGEEVKVTATIFDEASGIQNATLHYRVDGGEWNTISMSRIDDQWNAMIPGQMQGAKIEYYLTAYDRVGNRMESPAYLYEVITVEPPITGFIPIIAGIMMIIVAVVIILALKRKRRGEFEIINALRINFFDGWSRLCSWLSSLLFGSRLFIGL